MNPRGWSFVLVAAALLACDPLPAGGAPVAPPPPTTGAIHVVATANSLAHGCEMAGGNGPVLLVDGAEPTYGWFNRTTPALVEIAPGPHELTARCRDCNGVSLGEVTTSVIVAAGELTEARLDVVVPVAQGSVTVRWDTSGCGDPRAWVDTYFPGNPTCASEDVTCTDGEATLTHLLPGTYSLRVERYDADWTPTLGFCGCRGSASGVVVPEGPVAPGSIVVGPLTLPCACDL